MTRDILDELRQRIALHRGGGYPTNFYERVVAEIEGLRTANAALAEKLRADASVRSPKASTKDNR
ncbi:hypothetical protein FFK22_016865 [Mycobacterium sp. KBS0706]|uniref:hypothetical protein n=1 Tax=Mycobacterium sp. KBS0706 TaxID=2578109 RepID=UPI00110FBFBC|nr:hypothetical protein [Mycobacterium sp. KBS0706]TSD87515.1 hypothetical protein FFK22_016865 [Mycobacterium sp. KBS0706]